MKLKAQAVFDATLVLSQIIRENRPMPQKGSYRLARLHAKLLPEFNVITAKRDEMITAYGYHAPIPGHLVDGERQRAEAFSVPPDKADEFSAAWAEFAKEEIEVEAEPIPLAQIDLGDTHAGAISASELVTLGELVAE